MPINYINRNELQNTLAQLEQALYNHVQWHNFIIRTLICRLPGNKQDTKTSAHKECLFGQWYYNDTPKKLQDHPGFAAIGEAHKHMHQLTANLLLTVAAGNLIDIHDYDRFANALEQLRLEIFSLKHELELSLYTHDPLTGAINRADMLPVLRELHEMVKRDSQVCGISMMDLDHFKKINDEFGHPAGDKVLVSLVRYITENLRPYDKLFRYGGEEFLFCLQQTTLETCSERIEELRRGIKELPFDIGRSEPIHITVSFGVTMLEPDLTIEQCIERADKALFEAKNKGRDVVKIWDSSM
ncbi:MAG: diguanylate cyclase [Proteobacteria bacterium]|nr:diguanylate cyclase [Pseudomonadota bacterium]